MSIEPVKIPQNVQIEDRLIGPITIRQVILCLLGGGTSFVIWNIMKSAGPVNYGHLAIALIPLEISAAFAFIKFQGLSLLRMILLVVEKSGKPTLRTFAPRKGVTINIQSYYHTQSNQDPVKAPRDIEPDKFMNLSAVLDDNASKESLIDDEGETGAQGRDYKQISGAPPDTGTEKVGNPPLPVDTDRIAVEPRHEEAPHVDGISTGPQAASPQDASKYLKSAPTPPPPD